MGGGCIGYYVVGVLDVFWGVGNDEFLFGSGEVVVGNVDGDVLFLFGL